MAKTNIQKIIQKQVDKKMSEIRQVGINVINEVTQDLFKEAHNMYESFIDQFYSYHTNSYIRFDQHRPGTEMGTRLYRADNFKIYNKGKGIHSFEYDIDIPDDDYVNTPNYKHGTHQDVYENIMSGFRFKLDGINKSNEHYKIEMKWYGSYNGTYFSIGKTTPQKAFDEFEKQYHDISLNLFRERWRKKLKEVI